MDIKHLKFLRELQAYIPSSELQHKIMKEMAINKKSLK